jgi:ketosteroid isomerase-like protein
LTEVEWLVAHEQIRQLVARYALAVDMRDLSTLVLLFVDDVAVGRFGSGHRALERSFDESLGAIGLSVLHVGTQVIEVEDPNHASGVVYCQGQIQDGGRLIHQAIVYDDQYRRDDRWLFVRRRHRLFYGAEVGSNPLGLAPADWPTHHDGRGTLPEEWPTWQRFWERRNTAAPRGPADHDT